MHFAAVDSPSCGCVNRPPGLPWDWWAWRAWFEHETTHHNPDRAANGWFG